MKYAETRQFGVVLQYNIVPNDSRWNLVINGRRQVPTSLLILHLDQQPLVPIIIDIIAKWCIGQKQDSCNDLLLFFPGRSLFLLVRVLASHPTPNLKG